MSFLMTDADDPPISSIALEISISGSEIYSHSVVTVIASSADQFRLAFARCKVFRVMQGVRTGSDSIESVSEGSSHKLQAQVVGAFAHLPVRTDTAPRFGTAPSL